MEPDEGVNVLKITSPEGISFSTLKKSDDSVAEILIKVANAMLDGKE